MLPIDVEEIAAATGGIWLNPSSEAPTISTVSTDSRHITPDSLFFSLIGENFDGHDYINAALDAGAVGCVFSKELSELRTDKIYIQVSDTRRALMDFAAAYRKKFSIPFIQITGSVGKTSMKEMIASVLKTKLHILKTQENFNNDIGVSKTLFALKPEHQAAVIETGMNHFGEIEQLGQIVEPDIAIISNIGDSHIENLGNRDGILKAKCEIFTHLKPDGLAILNGDDKLLSGVNVPFRTIRCGYDEHCQVRVTDFWDNSVKGIACTIKTAKDTYSIVVPAPGAYMVYPAAMAVAVGEELRLSREDIIKGIAAYEPSGSRMRVIHLCNERILLDDCYNASPQSVTAALEVLARTECEKRIAILGDMKELGDISEKAHYNIGALTAMLGIDTVIAIGDKAVGIADGAAQNGGEVYYFPSKDMARKEIEQQLEPNSAILVKASHTMHFDELSDWLKEQFPEQDKK